MTTPYRPAVFTTKNDNSIGEPIDGSTGDPVNDYVYGGLVIEGYFSEDPVIKYARFLHFIVSPGIDVEGGSTITVKHCEFEDCSQAIYVPSTSYYPLPVSVQNCLFSGCGTAVYHNGYAQVIGVNLTIDNCSQVVDQSWPETYLTNCVLTDVSDVSAIAGTAYTVVTNASGVYQTAGAGNYYLANGSSYRDWGTTNIDPALVAEIAQMTTYPPTVYANTNFASSTTLSPHVECDTNSMDIGYHYAVLDYALSAATNSSTLTLTNGVVVGLFGTNGITMAGGASLESVGTPLALNRLVHCQLVQEQSPTGVPGAMVWLSGTGTTVDLRSTVLGAVSPVYYVYGSYLPNNVSLRDCELYGGSVALSVYGGGTVSVRNNLFRRVNTGAYYAGNLDMDQNLFWGGSVAFQDWPSTYGVYDNAFDGTDLSNLGLLSGQHHNAFINTSGYSSTNNGNLTLSNFTYSAGALGDFYQSANSPLHNAGSTNAGVLGFYHYTTTTNQVKETNSVVDIGYHYVSLDTANGLPIDSDLDGIPDYLDPDSDGDSLPDDWEIHWFGNLDATASDDPDGDWLTNYEEYLAGSNPSDVMVVAWGIANGGALAVPTNAQNVVSVDGNFEGSLALRADGSVVGWGTGAASLPNWTNIVQLSADWDQVAVVESDGIVSVLNTNDDLPPGDLTNAVQVAAGDGFCVALRASGTVTAWGANDAGQCDVPAGLASAKAVAAGWSHAVALLQDGSVAVWGDNGYGQTNKPSGLTNITAVAAGGLHSLALRADGTVIAWGTGWTNSGSLFNFGQAMVPSGLSNVVSISAGGYHSAALRSDGTVVVWGDLGSIAIPDVQGHIVAIGSGDMHILALRGGRLTPLIVSQPTDQFAPAGYTVEFTAVGTGLAGVHYQWQFNGTNIAGATNGTLTLLNVSSNDEGSYRAIVSTGAGSVLTSDATFTLVRPPVIVSTAPANPGEVWITNFFTLNVAATAAGQSQFPLSYQWQFNGTNLASGTSSNYYVYFSPTNEGEFTVGVSNAAGSTNAGPWRIHLLQPGGVAAWGANDYGECDSPYNLTNAISIAAGELHSVAVREDGSVVQWGYHWADVPADLTNAVQVAAGYEHSLALRADGTVTAWGDAGAPNWVPTNLSGVKAVSAGEYHNLALLTNGSVVAWGTSLWGVTNVPANLTNVTAISAGTQHNLALKADGTVVAWGWNDVGQTNVPAGLSNVIAIAAGGMHSLALKSDGTVVGWGYGNDGQCTPPSDLTNAMAIAAGWRHSVALRNDGMVVSWGDDSDGQGTAPALLTNVKLLAAGGNHTLAAVFSPLVQYPVDVSKDLLLIYNTNSADSIFVKNYYLAHRPMVSGANVLGLNCTTNPVIPNGDFTNQLLTPVLNWLAANPTKRPQYMVMFLGVPARLENMTDLGSASYLLRQSMPGFQPFITHIHMGDTNACRAYIDKLQNFGTNYSPGQLIISASKGGYANTNLLFDNVVDYSYTNNPGNVLKMSNAVVSIQAMNLTNLSVAYVQGVDPTIMGPPLPPHITNAMNVAGYVSWGYHSSLGSGYATNNTVRWEGDSGWWLIETYESENGVGNPNSGDYLDWFSSNAFGGTNYVNTPIGAVGHVQEPTLSNVNDAARFFGLWGLGKRFPIAAWESRLTIYFQAVGDPFVTR